MKQRKLKEENKERKKEKTYSSSTRALFKKLENVDMLPVMFSY
jgi:hypothetical protein